MTADYQYISQYKVTFGISINIPVLYVNRILIILQ